MTLAYCIMCRIAPCECHVLSRDQRAARRREDYERRMRAGETQSQIAKSEGISYQAVHDTLRRGRKQRLRPGREPGQHADRDAHILDLYAGQHKTLGEIAAIYGITPARVSQVVTAGRAKTWTPERVERRHHIEAPARELRFLAFMEECLHRPAPTPLVLAAQAHHLLPVLEEIRRRFGR